MALTRPPALALAPGGLPALTRLYFVRFALVCRGLPGHPPTAKSDTHRLFERGEHCQGAAGFMQGDVGVYQGELRAMVGLGSGPPAECPRPPRALASNSPDLGSRSEDRFRRVDASGLDGVAVAAPYSASMIEGFAGPGVRRTGQMNAQRFFRLSGPAVGGVVSFVAQLGSAFFYGDMTS